MRRPLCSESPQAIFASAHDPVRDRQQDQVDMCLLPTKGNGIFTLYNGLAAKYRANWQTRAEHSEPYQR